MLAKRARQLNPIVASSSSKSPTTALFSKTTAKHKAVSADPTHTCPICDETIVDSTTD